MSVLFDENRFLKSQKAVNKGKKKYALRAAILHTVFFLIYIPLFTYIFDRDNILSVRYIIYLIIFSILFFIAMYFVYKKDWEKIANNYEETVEYYKKHDPSFLEKVLKHN